MNAEQFQQSCQRTECDYWRARGRIVNGDLKAANDRDLAFVTNESALKATRLVHAVIGITGEAGELASQTQKSVYYGKELDVKNIKEELGDLLWYISLLCNTLGLSLEDVMEANQKKLSERYPDKYTDFLADEVNRNREAEADALEG